MLSIDRAILMIVDVQGKLAQLMHDKAALFRNLDIVIRGSQILQLPVLWLEQNPAGLGPTVPEIAGLLSAHRPISKMSFSALGCSEAADALRASDRSQVLLCGIEAHVCVYLSAADLLARGYEVEVIADAVSSRSAANKQIGLTKTAALGARISCTETVLFELLGRAEGQPFKEIIRLLKD